MLKIDISNKIIAEILLQIYLNSKWYPITLFLKIMDLIKSNYEVYNKKILAII